MKNISTESETEQNTGILCEKTQDNYNYLSNEKIDGSPLWLIKNNEDGTEWSLIFGNYELKRGNSKNELKEYVNNNILNIVTNIAIIVCEKANEINNQVKKDESL